MNAGLILGTVSNQNSGTVPAGNVISQSPAAGTMVGAGTSVDVYGSTDDGRKLRRVDGLLAEVFWIIWSHFEKGTDVNRA